MPFVRLIDTNVARNRAVFVIIDNKDMFFGLAIRREKNSHIDRWAFYVEIQEEEYNLLVESHSKYEALSFIGMPSVQISIPESITSMFGLKPPTRYAGVHFNSDPFGAGWADSSISQCIESHYNFVKQVLQNEKAA